MKKPVEAALPGECCCDKDGESKRRLLLQWVGIKDAVTGILAIIAVVQGAGYISGERAIVFAEAASLPGGLGDIDPLPIRLEVRNGGKAVATIKEVAAAISHDLPPTPQEIRSARFGSPPVVPGGVVRHTYAFEVARGGYPSETVKRLKDGDLKFYLFGVIRYSDWMNFPALFGYKETGFCFEYAGRQETFETCRNPAYSYSK